MTGVSVVLLSWDGFTGDPETKFQTIKFLKSVHNQPYADVLQNRCP